MEHLLKIHGLFTSHTTPNRVSPFPNNLVWYPQRQSDGRAHNPKWGFLSIILAQLRESFFHILSFSKNSSNMYFYRPSIQIASLEIFKDTQNISLNLIKSFHFIVISNYYYKSLHINYKKG